MIESIYDIDLLGTVDDTGKIKEYFDKDAVQNSIFVWLTSYRTDCIRNPGHGGYLTNFLSRLMTEENRKNIKNSLIDGFYQDYDLVVKLQSLEVTPDYENKTWLIYIEAYIPDIKNTVTVSALVNNLV